MSGSAKARVAHPEGCTLGVHILEVEQRRDDHMDVGGRILPGHSQGCEW